MRLLVSGSTGSMRRLLPQRPDRLGVLMTPGAGNRVGWWPEGATWAADNLCFRGLDVPAWLKFLAKLAASDLRPSWVACPDVVGDAARTWELYDLWSPLLRSMGLPVAFVLQDGMHNFAMRGLLTREILERRLAAVFVGGSTAFKVGDVAASCCRQAKDHGLLVHVGRVNSLRRILYFARRCRDEGWSVDSIDGGTAVWGDTNLPKMIRFIDRALACRQSVAFGGVA